MDIAVIGSAGSMAWLGSFSGAVLSILPAVLMMTGACSSKHKEKEAETAIVAEPKVIRLNAVPADQRNDQVSYQSGSFRIVYLDRGDVAELLVRSQGNPILLADYDADGKVVPDLDRWYGVDLDEGRLCSGFISSDTVDCTTESTRAKATWARVDDKNDDETYQVDFVIPRAEFGDLRHLPRFVVKSFSPTRHNPNLQFPSVPEDSKTDSLFVQSFELAPSSGPVSLQSAPPVLPARPAPVQLGPMFEAIPQYVFLNGTTQLNWRIPGAASVTIQPEIGSVAQNGSKKLLVDRQITYTLTAEYASGKKISRAVTVFLRDVEIVWFKVCPPRVAYGNKYSIDFLVRGARSVSFTPKESQAKKTQFDSPGLVDEIRHSQKETASVASFPSPGVYTIELNVEGPGGPKIARRPLEVTR